MSRTVRVSREKKGECRLCGDPIDELNAAFEGCVTMCFDCWIGDDMGETGYDGDGV